MTKHIHIYIGDSEQPRKRMFPNYTTAELEKDVESEADPDIKSKIKAEIAARKAGISQIKVTPQVAPASKNATPFGLKR